MSTQADFAENVSSNLNRQILQYSVAAAAAGVSILALAQAATGEVIVTKKPITIPLTSVDTPDPVRLSMANNGVDDFGFNLNLLSNGVDPSYFRFLGAYGIAKGNAVIGTDTFIPYAFALPRGAKIGPSVQGSNGTFLYSGPIVEKSLGDNSGRGLRGHWVGIQRTAISASASGSAINFTMGGYD